jgi:hypothetical protein
MYSVCDLLRTKVRISAKGVLRSTLLAALLGATTLGCGTAPAQAQTPEKAANDAIQAAIQSAIQSARDQVQLQRVRRGSRPLSFSGEPYDQEAYFNDAFEAFGALGYAKGAVVTKAAPPPPPPDLVFSVWGQGAYDREHRRGTFLGVDIGSTTRTETVTAGGDVIKTGVFSNQDVLLVGLVGSHAWSQQATNVGANARSRTPSVGFYAAYIFGDASLDYSFTSSRTHTDTTTLAIVTVTDSEAFSHTGNANYRVNNFAPGWWMEGTTGMQYTRTHFLNMPGAADGETWRAQIGARFGTEIVQPDGVRLQPTLAGYAYSDVSVNPGGLPVAIAPPTDQGKLWGKGVAKLNVQFTDKVSAAVEGEVRGTRDVTGYAARVSGRISLN